MRMRLIGSVAVALIVVVVGIAAWFLAGDWLADRRCPLYIAESLRQHTDPADAADPWTVYSNDGARADGAPKVTVKSSSVSPGSWAPKSCQLKIASAPEAPGKGADWRMGHAFGNPAAARGRTVTFRAQLKGDRDLRFDSAYIYIWDGVGWTTAPISRVTQDWQTVQARHTLDPNATAFEVWIRLVFDAGTIRPGKGTLYFVANVEG